MADIVRMPSLSPTMEEGVIESWAKQIGEYVESEQVIAHIETDKAIVEYESVNEGYLRHQFIEPGGKVAVGQPIAVLSEDENEDVADLIAEGDAELSGSTPAAATAEAPPAPAPAAPPSPAPAPTASTTKATDYDVAVIGAGPGGYVAAIRAAQLGLKTALIDKQWLGGVCLNVGCIPSKSLLKNADVIHTIRERGEEFGFSYDNLKVDYSVAVKRSRKVSEKLTKGIGYLCKKNNISVHMGAAEFKDANTLSITDGDGKNYDLTAQNIIIATGSDVRRIPGVDIDGKKVLTYWEAILQETVPEKAVIVGSGAIGVEFATVWNAYGSDVTIVEMLPTIVPNEDKDVSDALQKSFKKSGIRTMVNSKVENIDVSGPSVKVTVTGPKGQETLEADQVMVAIGFVPNSDKLGLDKVGVNTDRGAIVIDDQMRTNVPNIYAIGDVTAKLMLAHVGSAMGIVAAEVIAGHPTPKLDYDMMPRATYCHPQVASMGLTEAQAKEKGHQVKVVRFPYGVNGKALGLGETEGFVKIVVDEKYGEILGAHLIGPEVTELLTEFTLAQAAELTIEEIARNVHAHPTLSEAIMEAAHGALGDYIHI